MWHEVGYVKTCVPYILHCGLKATQKVCDVGSPVATVCPSLLLTSEGLHIPHLSKTRTNDRWWLDCRKQKLQFACWLLKRRRKGIVHKGMVASQQPPAIYTIQPLYESAPPPSSHPDRYYFLCNNSESWGSGCPGTLKSLQAPRGPFSQTGTKWAVTNCHWGFLMAPTARYLNTGRLLVQIAPVMKSIHSLKILKEF